MKFYQVNEHCEQQAREHLAALYRIMALFGWVELITNHISVRVPGTDDQFLILPFGFLFDQVTASSLIKVDLAGNILSDTDFTVQTAGHVIHSGIYADRSDINCIIHTHTPNGRAFSCLQQELICEDQMSMMLYQQVAYHDFHGCEIDHDKQCSMQQSLADKKCLVLRNHGLLASGRNVAEAFWYYYFLEMACDNHLKLAATGKSLNTVSDRIKRQTQAELVGHQLGGIEGLGLSGESLGTVDVAFCSLLDKLDRLEIDYKS